MIRQGHHGGDESKRAKSAIKGLCASLALTSMLALTACPSDKTNLSRIKADQELKALLAAKAAKEKAEQERYAHWVPDPNWTFRTLEECRKANEKNYPHYAEPNLSDHLDDIESDLRKIKRSLPDG